MYLTTTFYKKDDSRICNLFDIKGEGANSQNRLTETNINMFWVSDNRQGHISKTYNLVQTFPKALHSDNQSVGTI